MATTLALAMRASMSAGGVVSGANQAAGAMGKMGKQAQKTAKDVNTLKNIAIGAVLAKGAMAAANAFRSASSAVLGYANGLRDAIDRTAKLARQSQISVEALQGFNVAAKLGGSDLETFSTNIKRLTVNVGRLAAEGKTGIFSDIGIDFERFRSLDPEQQFAEIGTAINAIKDPAEKARVAVTLFGKAGTELLPIFESNLEAIAAQAKRLGIILSADQTQAVEDMNDALTMVQATFQGIIGQVVGNLAPVVTALAEEFLAFVESFNSVSGEGGTGIANAITDAMFDILDYLAQVFDNAVAGFEGFGTTMEEVGAVFDFVGNTFVAIAETLRGVFNIFEIAGNTLMEGLGAFLENLGSWVSKDLENFGKTLRENSRQAGLQNTREANAAFSNAGSSASAAVFGSEDAPRADGPASRAVRSARERNTPEAKAEREAARKQREAEARAAKEAADAEAKAKRDAEEAKKREEEAAKRAEKAAAVQEKVDAKSGDIADIEGERAKELGQKSNEALQANDVRSSEGMSQFLALATGREDPAIAEYRKQTQKLEELKAELRALQQEKVEILGGAA
jgi:flagellar biosynthesis GTPase FlhF